MDDDANDSTGNIWPIRDDLRDTAAELAAVAREHPVAYGAVAAWAVGSTAVVGYLGVSAVTSLLGG